MTYEKREEPSRDNPHEQIREKVAAHIKPELVDEIMDRPIPAFDGVTLNEAVEENPELAHEMVDRMFDWRDANG